MKITRADVAVLHKGEMKIAQSVDGERHCKTLPYLSIVEAVEGSYSIALGGGEEYSTGAHGFFIAPAHVLQSITHHVDPRTGRMHCRWLFVDLLLNREYSPEALYDLPQTVTGERAEHLHTLFEALFSTDDRIEEYSLTYAVMGEVFSHAQRKESPTEARLSRSLAFIRENYATPIRIARLAQLEHMSESNYYALFRRELGISPTAYINHYRLTLAAEELANTQKSVAAIGASVGIPDPLYFSKLFVRTYHTSPTQYRRERQKRSL